MSEQPISSVSEPRLTSSFAAATSSWLPSVILLLVTIVAWEAAVRIFAISTFIIPAPSQIAQSLVAQWGTLMQATLVTAAEILLGFVVSV
ncbi:ABC transporter permease, partial [Streptococcus pyogenes]